MRYHHPEVYELLNLVHLYCPVRRKHGGIHKVVSVARYVLVLHNIHDI